MQADKEVGVQIVSRADDGSEKYGEVQESGSGFRGWLNRHRVRMQPSIYAPNSKWSNRDMDPIAEEHRTWGFMSFICYWISDALVLNIVELGSSMIALGMSWELSLVAISLGFMIVSIPISLNGVVGSIYRVPFPVIVRASFGFYFGWFAILIRAILSIFWLGVTAASGAQAVQQCLNAIWPSFRTLPNHLPASANITTAGMISYFVYSVIEFPIVLIPVHKLRWFFIGKAIFVPIALIGMLGYLMHASGGAGNPEVFGVGGSISSGSALAWTFLGNLNTVIGDYASLSINIADLSRYSRHRNTQYIQLIAIPVTFTIICFCGIGYANGSRALYGEAYWNPLEILDHWRSSGGRAAAFFVAAAWVWAQIACNISANSISAANDLNAMFPEWLSIKRGQILAMIISHWAITPWNITAKAGSLLSFLSACVIVLAPFAAIMIVDAFVLRRLDYSVPDLFNSNGIYRYNKYGTNWPAVVAILFSTGPLIPGMANAINSNVNIGNASKLYDIGYIYGFTVAGVLYYGLSKYRDRKNGA